MARYSFGDFVLDTDQVVLTGPDGERTCEPQVFDVLRWLVEAHGRLVSKEELLDNIWGDRFISESALTTRIKQARRLVDDDGRRQWAIKTVHGRGYRFVADVARADAGVGTPEAPTALELPRDLTSVAGEMFVGREDELGTALEIIEAAAPGSTSWIWLLGEPGIGKTHLAARVASLVHTSGTRVLFGRCSEDLAVPYQPIIEALRAATDALHGEELRRALGGRAHELVRLLPDLATRVDGLEGPRPADADTERYRLFEGVVSWLAQASRSHSLLLVIDDAHWATDSTLQLLDHIARSSAPGAITVLVTARDTAPDGNPLLAQLIARLQGQRNQAVIRLGGLAPMAALQLLNLGAPSATTEADVRTVLEQTAGNPLLIRALGPDGAAAVDLDSAVRRRLASVRPRVQETLTIASVIGLEFDLKVLSGAAGRDELDVLDDLEEAIAARLLVEGGGDRFRFVHALVRGSLRAQLSAARLARWHARLGAAIEATSTPNEETVVALAHHYAEAASVDPSLGPTAIEYLSAAADRFSSQLSFSDAIRQLEAAVDLAGPDDHRRLAELALALGDAHKAAGTSVVARRSFSTAFDHARAAGDADLVAAAALRYEDASWRPGEFGRPAVQRLRTAEAMIDPGDARTRARLFTALTRAHALSGELDRSRAAWRRASALIDEIDDVGLRVRGLNAYLSTLHHREWPRDVTLAQVDHLAQLAQQVDDVEDQMLARQVQLFYLARSGRMDEYRRVHREMGAATRGIHSSFWDYIHANHEAMLRLYEGELDAAELAAEDCMQIAERLVEEDNSGTYGLRMFMIRREQERLGPVMPLVQRLAGAQSSMWTPGLALLLAETGHRDDARVLLDGFAEADFAIPPDAMWTTVMTMFIELAAVLHDASASRLLYERFLDQTGLLVVTGHGIICLGSTDRYLGMAALTFGDLDLAESHLHQAIDLDGDNGSPLWAAHAELWLAQLRMAQDRPQEAAALAASVEQTARERGFVALCSRSTALLDR